MDLMPWGSDGDVEVAYSSLRVTMSGSYTVDRLARTVIADLSPRVAALVAEAERRGADRLRLSVRAVHTTEFDDKWCDECEDSYPCATVLALATPAPADAEPHDQRDPACVTAWPGCEEGAYNPACCRFPKSCSCTIRGPR